MDLALFLICIYLQHKFKDFSVTSEACVLDWPHGLARFRVALQIEVCAIAPQQLQHAQVLGSNCEEHRTDAIVVSLFVDVDPGLPIYPLVEQGPFSFLLIGYASNGTSSLESMVLFRQDGLFAVKLNNVVESSLDGDMETRCAFLVLCVFD